MALPEAAVAFARERHAGQMRKDGRTPYITHPIRVAQRLQDLGVDDPALLSAALLHDTIEDTPTTHEEIAARFGAEVADLVEEVTRRPDVLRRDFTDRLRDCSGRAVLIRLADRLDNLTDGQGLGADFLPTYAQEALQMVSHALQNHRVHELPPQEGDAFLALAAKLVDAAAKHLPFYKGETAPPGRRRRR